MATWPYWNIPRFRDFSQIRKMMMKAKKKKKRFGAMRTKILEISTHSNWKNQSGISLLLPVFFCEIGRTDHDVV